MSDLQTAYYIVALVFMGVIFLLLLALLATALVIRAKISALHDKIAERVETVTDLAEKGGAVLGTLKKVTRRKKK